MPQVTYRLDQFEGPLDLLLMLISKNKVSIADIPIVLICDQYMEYIAEAQRMDLEIASEFIVMATELMVIKSKMLLPHEEGTDQDPRRTIQDALILYQKAKRAASRMRPLYEEYSGRFVKETDEVPPEKGLPLNLDPDLLLKALDSVMRRMKIAQAETKPQELVNPLIKHRVISVEEKIEQMCAVLEEQQEASLFFLLKDSEGRSEIVARFMGILEMIKVQRVFIASVIEVEEGITEYEDKGLDLMLKLNPDYVPSSDLESEFDAPPKADEEIT